VTGFKGAVRSALPSNVVEYHIPVQVLDTRMVKRGSSQVAQVLVRWLELPYEMVSWEDSMALWQQFPHAPAWGQAGLQGGRNVSTAKDSNIQTLAPEDGPHHGSRPKKQNKRVSGPEWV
jgi:hypothetical protein